MRDTDFDAAGFRRVFTAQAQQALRLEAEASGPFRGRDSHDQGLIVVNAAVNHLGGEIGGQGVADMLGQLHL